jgi:sulfur-carrier protein
MSRPLSVLWFAWLRERVGVAEETVSPPRHVRTVADLMTWLSELDQRHASAFANPQTVRCAVNQEFADPMTLIQPGDEIAFFPPVTGG